MPELASDPEHSGITGDDLEQYLQSRLGPVGPTPVVPGQQPSSNQFRAGASGPPPGNVDETGSASTIETPPQFVPDEAPDEPLEQPGEETEEPEEDEEEGEEQPPPAEAYTEPSQPPVPPTIEIAPGFSVPRQQIEALLRFDQMIGEDEQLRLAVEQAIRQRVQGQQVPLAPPEPPQPQFELPEEYRDDPALQAITQRIEQQQALIEEQRQQLTNVNNIVTQRQQEENQARYVRVSQQFAADHNLNEEQLAGLSNVAARMNVMEQLVRGVDPLTGQATPRDPDQWINRALEIAYWSVPEYRDREYGKKVQQRAKDQQRKQRLAGVGGASGSVPRVSAIPTTEAERLAAARREMAEFMGRSEE